MGKVSSYTPLELRISPAELRSRVILAELVSKKFGSIFRSDIDPDLYSKAVKRLL